jgi:pimeloyl-ACP methyl ester carboxylesterase
MMRRDVFLRDGLRLNAVKGDGATPVFFQHGLCGSAEQTIEAFPVDARFALRTLECRGHGGSEFGSEKLFSINTFSDDVDSFVEAEKTGPAVVGGISMGAAIALRLAVYKPQRMKALVLARPAWQCEAAPENLKPNAKVGALLEAFSPAEACARFMASETAKHLTATSPDNLASLQSFFAREPIAVTSALLQRIAADGPGVTPEQVKAIAVPTLIIATDHDDIHPLSHAYALKTMIPHATLTIITAKGVDKQRYLSEFRSALLQFLEVHA